MKLILEALSGPDFTVGASGTGSRSRSKNEIHACLARRLQARPPCSDLFGVKGRQWLARLELPVEERESVGAAMRHVEFLDAEIAAVEKLITKQALSWREIRRLLTAHVRLVDPERR